MDTEPPRREPNQVALPHPTGHDEIHESDNKGDEVSLSQYDAMSNVFFACATPMRDEEEPLTGLTGNPVPQISVNEPVIWLPQGERWDGVIGTYVRMAKNDEGVDFLEFGAVHEQPESQERLPFVPSSFANLDLARVTAWGWILWLGTSFATLLTAIASGQVLRVLGVGQLPQFLLMPAAILVLGLWGVLFVLGRVALESRNVTVVRRKMARTNTT